LLIRLELKPSLLSAGFPWSQEDDVILLWWWE
jgi:hypothetical protein